MPFKKTSNKNVQPEKHTRSSTNLAKTSKGSAGVSSMKMTLAQAPTLSPRMHHRKVLRLAAKRPGAHHHRSLALASAKGRPTLRQALALDTACDNSDDSGLGFDHHMDQRLHYGDRNTWIDEVPEIKRRKMDLKVENEEANDGYCFPDTIKTKENQTIIRSLPSPGAQNLGGRISQNISSKNIGRCPPLLTRRSTVSGPVTLTSQLSSSSRNGKVYLQIIHQPEQQHRARYQTEGSRGAVKDRSGNGFPIVKLIGYDKPTTLQIFIGTDLGRVAPHMFYQACRVSGKNSTPCVEKKIDGTIVIEVELEPAKEMIATCDCVGILKERNVDVEHRFPEQLSPRSKKKSTKCRMVFRTAITHEDGTTEVLQVCSHPIVCTQPPGIPEICKKSLSSCPVSGGLELFILGKNFLKDTQVVFQQHGAYDASADRPEIIWQETVSPDKEFLQQTHLVCVVPPFIRQDVSEPVSVRLFVVSSGKNSESHSFLLTPLATGASPASALAPAVCMESQSSAPFLSKMLWQTGNPKQEMDLGMMPPPTSLVPLAQRRSSTNLCVDSVSPPMRSLKTELIDESSQESVMEHMMNENSMDMRHRFRHISESSLDVQHDDTNMTMINENSIDILRRQEIIKNQIEIMNENSNSVHSFHCEKSKMSENSMDLNLMRREILNPMKSQMEILNESSSSVHSFHCEKSNASMHNEESLDNSRTETRIFAQSLRLPHTVVQSEISNSSMASMTGSTLSRDDLKGIDLRIKATPSLVTLNELANRQPPSLTTLNDLANTQPPSLATLRRFVVTEPTNMPLPTQTGQSVENYLTTLENTVNNKPILSNSIKNELMLQSLKSQSLLEGTILSNQGSILSSQSSILSNQFSQNSQPSISNPGTNIQVITNHEIIPNCESHLISSSPMFTSQAGSNGLMETSQAEVKQTLQTLQAAINANINATINANMAANMAAIQNGVSVQIGSPIKSPQQEMLIGNKSPLIPSSPQEVRRSPLLVSQSNEIIISHSSPEVMLNSQTPLLSSTMAPNELIIHSPRNEIVSSHVSPNTLTSETILNPRVSPSVMCRNSQDTLLQVNGSLNNICQPMQTNQIQSEMMSESTNNGLIMTSESPNNSLMMTSESANNGLMMTSDSANNRLMMTSDSTNNGLMMTSESPNNRLIMTSESPNNGLMMTSESANNGLMMTSESANNGLMMTSESANNGLMMTSESANNDLMMTSESTNNGLLSTLKSSVTVESIVMNAAMDYLETKKKVDEIRRLDLLQQSVEQQNKEQSLINSLLEVRNNPPTPETNVFANQSPERSVFANNQSPERGVFSSSQSQEPVFANSQSQVLMQISQMPQQPQFVNSTNSQSIMISGEKPQMSTNEYLNQMNIQVSKQESNKSDLNLVSVDQKTTTVSQTPEMKKNEEGMILPALTNMSENDLISYINPSCFDQDSTATFSTNPRQSSSPLPTSPSLPTTYNQ